MTRQGHCTREIVCTSLEPAMQVFAPMWANQRVFVHSDNKATPAIMKKGTCRDPVVMKSLRRVFWLMVLDFIWYIVHLVPLYQIRIIPHQCSNEFCGEKSGWGTEQQPFKPTLLCI